MNTSIGFDLKSFATDVQGVLRTRLACTRISVAAHLSQATLKFLIQHPPSLQRSPEDVFAAARSVIRTHWHKQRLTPITSPTIETVGIYLRQTDQAHPYAGRRIRLTALTAQEKLQTANHSGAMTSTAPPAPANSSQKGASEKTSGDRSVAPTASQLLSPPPSQGSESSVTVSPPADREISSDSQDSQEQDVSLTLTSTMPSPSEESSPRRGVSWRTIKMSMAGLTVVLSGVALYGLTRPCVVGACSAIEEAHQLSLESTELLRQYQSESDVLNAYDRLIDANFRLRKIPFWSRYYDQAQAILANYEADADEVAQVVEAQRQAREAMIHTQQPPYPLEVWQEGRAKWQAAIAQLQTVPTENPIMAELVRAKLAEYQMYLIAVNRQISREKMAQDKIAEARETVKLAEAREGAANSAESWQVVNTTWQEVMDRLAGVPEDTMAYAEAQQLIAIYEHRLVSASDRIAIEEISSTAYDQAIDLASQAIDHERNSQWREAVVSWQQALAYAEQVPKEITYYDQVRPLLSFYAEALSRAEQNMTTASAVEQVRPILERGCTSLDELCTYTLSVDAMHVYIAPGYDQVIQRAMLSGGVAVQENDSEPNGARDSGKASGLLRAIAQAGNTSRVAVRLYDSEGNLMGIYEPEAGGYVQPQVAVSAERSS